MINTEIHKSKFKQADINSNIIEVNGNHNQEFENELFYLNTNQLKIEQTEIFKFQKLIEEKYQLNFGKFIL